MKKLSKGFLASLELASEHTLFIIPDTCYCSKEDLVQKIRMEAGYVKPTECFGDWWYFHGKLERLIEFDCGVFAMLPNELMTSYIDEDRGVVPAALMRSKIDKETCIVFQKAYKKSDGTYKMSIRISESCDLNANNIAHQYGGGGHPKAAGCDMTKEDINNLSNKSVFIPMWEYNSCFTTAFFTLEEAKEDARTWEYPCDDLGNWDEDEIEIFEMILTKPLPKNRLLRNIDLPEYGKVIRKHYIFI